MPRATRDDPETRADRMAELLEEFRSRREQQIRQLANVDAALAEARALVDLAQQQAKYARDVQLAAASKSRRSRTRR